MSPKDRRTQWIKSWTAALVFASIILGCGLFSQVNPVPVATQAVVTSIPSPTTNYPGTQTVQASTAVKSTQDAESTATASQAVAATATQGFRNTATALSKATQAARNTDIANDLKSTDAAQAATATAQEGAMAQLIAKLKKDGYLAKTRGSYHRLDDFDESWAQMNWYEWFGSGHSPKEFVVRADASWDSASTVANWFNSGCGFIFSEQDRDNHQLVFWGLDGYVYAGRLKEGDFYPLGFAYYGPVSTPKGDARIMLVVENEMLTAFVNGRKILRVRDPYYTKGDLAMTLLSGTNKDFGTRCQMKNIELWWLE
jgi:hypothetical protein